MSKGAKFITVKNPPYVSAGETKKCFKKPHLNWIGQKMTEAACESQSTPQHAIGFEKDSRKY